MKSLKLITAIVFSTIIVAPVFADKPSGNVACTDDALQAANNYDPGMGAVTTCIQHRDDVEVVVAWNSNQRHNKTYNTTGATVGQQVINARNLARDYENNYGMAHGEEFDIVVVAYAAGVDWLKKTTDQANQDLVNSLMAKGIKIYACQNTMKAKGVVLADLIDGVETVPAGVSAVVDFQAQGRLYLMP